MRLGYKGAGCLVLHYSEKTHKVYILLGKRTSGIGAGTWSIPGGGWETKDGKSLQNTARRELCEEVFIRVSPNYKLMKIWESKFTPFFDYSVFAVRLANKIKIRRWTEFSKVGWFEISKLPNNVFWMVPEQVKSLVRIMKERGYQIA